MDGKFVYLLWSHGEYGPVNLAATLDPHKLPELAEMQNSTHGGKSWFERADKPRLVEDLRAMIPVLIGSPQVVPLMDGWGGLHVQVVQTDSFAESGNEG